MRPGRSETGVARSGRCRSLIRPHWVFVLLIVPSATGCIGPRSLQLTRLRYDQAVHETTDQQWLRNIVQLRYGDLPTFLDVAAITSQFELSGRGGLSAGQQRDSANQTLFGDTFLQFRDAPTLSYTPRDPTELMRVMVAPVGITALGLMANTGWSVHDVLRVVVAEMNGLENVPGAEQMVPTMIPPFTPFAEAAKLGEILRHERVLTLAAVELPHVVSSPIPENRVDGADVVLAANNKLSFQPASRADAVVLTQMEPAYKLVLAEAARDMPQSDALRKLLQLAPDRNEFAVHRVNIPGGLTVLPLPKSNDSVEVRTRSLLEMLTFLSKGVQIPEEHLNKGLAVQVAGPDGLPFDWTQVTRGLFHVCVQKKRPKDAAIAIEYQGYWFFISARDHRSKSSLALIQGLFNLQLSEPKKGGPLLTLPAGL